MNNLHAKTDAPLYMRDFTAFENKNLEQKVQELADREEIRELISNYAHRTAKGASSASLFTDDGAFICRRPNRPLQEVKGRAELDKFYGAFHGLTDYPKPMIHNYLLDISGDEATGLCSNEVRMVENGESIIGSGFYEDTFRRVNGHWKFVVRYAEFFHWVPIQQGWSKPTGAA